MSKPLLSDQKVGVELGEGSAGVTFTFIDQNAKEETAPVRVEVPFVFGVEMLAWLGKQDADTAGIPQTLFLDRAKECHDGFFKAIPEGLDPSGTPGEYNRPGKGMADVWLTSKGEEVVRQSHALTVADGIVTELKREGFFIKPHELGLAVNMEHLELSKKAVLEHFDLAAT